MDPGLKPPGLFYKGEMFLIQNLWHLNPMLLASIFAIGILVISFYVGQLIRLILSLYVLPGKPVCCILEVTIDLPIY